MSSHRDGISKTAAALAAIGTHMDMVAAATPLGPWREPVIRCRETPDQIKARILRLIDRLNAQNAPLRDAAE
jgi:hypothetical protein